MVSLVDASDSNQACATSGGEVVFNQESLTSLAQAAAQRWIATGLTAEQTTALSGITYQIADIGVGKLGVAEGSTITIDDDAAGSGSWFIDSTPYQNEEFDSSLVATSGGREFEI